MGNVQFYSKNMTEWELWVRSSKCTSKLPTEHLLRLCWVFSLILFISFSWSETEVSKGKICSILENRKNKTAIFFQVLRFILLRVLTSFSQKLWFPQARSSQGRFYTGWSSELEWDQRNPLTLVNYSYFLSQSCYCGVERGSIYVVLRTCETKCTSLSIGIPPQMHLILSALIS